VGCAATRSTPHEPPRSLAPRVLFCCPWLSRDAHLANRKEGP
jgi:hypothetical protein